MNRIPGLAVFELRYQAWRLTFFATLLCLAFVPVTLVATGFGPRADAVNGAFVVTESLALLSLISVFALPLLCVHAALRDDEHGMRGLVDSRPVSRGLLLAARFGGVLSLLLLVLALCTLLLAALPTVFPPRADRLVSFAAAPYWRAYVWLVVPNALWCTALLFAVAAATRSTLATFVASVCIYAGYMVTALMVDSPLMAGTRPPTPELLARAALFDPFGLSAVFEQTRYLTPTERHTYSLSLSGHLLQNRLLVLRLALLCTAPLLWLDERVARGLPARVRRWWKPWWRSAREHAAAEPGITGNLDGVHVKAGRRENVQRDAATSDAAWNVPRASPRLHGAAVWWRTMRDVAAMESRLLLRSWPLLLLLVTWVIIVFIEADGQLRGGEYGTRVLASTAQLADAVPQALELLGALCVLYFAVEVFGREQVVRFAGMRDATPASGTAMLTGKLMALFMVPVLLTLLGYGTTVIMHVLSGGLPIEWDVLGAFVAVSIVPLAITTAMAAALQGLIGQRWLAMFAGLMVLVFSAQGAALGAEHPLWRFGAAPPIGWSDLSGYGPGLHSWLAFQFTWALGALLLLWTAAGVWTRGEALSFGRRVRAAPRLLRQGLGVSGLRALGVSALLFVSVVAGMVWLTTQRAPWITQRADIARRVEYEHRYGRLQGVAQPSITHAALTVTLEPEAARASVRGTLQLTNTSGHRVDTLWATFPLGIARVRLDSLPESLVLAIADSQHLVYAVALHTALLPDSTMSLPFAVELDGSGIRADGNPIDVVANGTYLHSADFLPRFGFARGRPLRDSLERAAQGLPVRADSLLLPASQIDSVTAEVRHHGQTPAWFSADVIIETDGDQVAHGPGRLVSQQTRGGRSIWRYQRAQPATTAFVITSGRYAVKRDSVQTPHGVVPVEVWHNPRHAGPAERLREVSIASLVQLTRDFGPYPHDALRVIEVSSLHRFGAYAMPGSIYLSETRGMLSDARAGAVDLLLRRIGHEVAHEWWGHAVNPLDVEGRLLLVETMAKYAEQLLVGARQGERMVHAMLAFDEDRYLRSRNVQEASLVSMVDDDALFYGKGALAMHAMRHLLGDSVVLRVTRDVLRSEQGPRGAATAQGFMDRLMRAAPSAEARDVVLEWFAERVVYDFALDSAALVPTGLGTRVTAHFRATRLAFEGQGSTSVERATPLHDVELPVGLRDGQGAWRVLRVRAVHGLVALDTVVSGQMQYLEIDPERLYLEKDRSNNGAR